MSQEPTKTIDYCDGSYSEQEATYPDPPDDCLAFCSAYKELHEFKTLGKVYLTWEEDCRAWEHFNHYRMYCIRRKRDFAEMKRKPFKDWFEDMYMDTQDRYERNEGEKIYYDQWKPAEAQKYIREIVVNGRNKNKYATYEISWEGEDEDEGEEFCVEYHLPIKHHIALSPIHDEDMDIEDNEPVMEHIQQFYEDWFMHGDCMLVSLGDDPNILAMNPTHKFKHFYD